MKKIIWLAMISSLAFAQLDQKTSRELMTQRRGQVPVRGSNPLTLTGTVFDASCKDRSSLNLAVPPESLAETVPAQPAATAAGAKTNAPAGGVSVDGITVSAKTLAAERSDPLEHQVPDLRTRQQDPTCAITGATSLYAIALSDGRILNLDEGGNTLAGESVLQSSQGRAMLNGTAYGFKPRAKVTGRIRGDRLFVEQLSFF